MGYGVGGKGQAKTGYGVAVLLCLASALAAQQPVRPRPDSSHIPAPSPIPHTPDSTQNPRPDVPVTPRDTSHQLADSLNPDSTRPVLPLLANGAGPRGAQTRY